jgi:hypothetical protein
MTDSLPDRLRLGMVGGGRGAFIGETHRIAARLDDRYELVAGALSTDPHWAIESGRDLRLDPTRCYTDYRDMAQAEAARNNGIDVVSVVTPNVSHHAICKSFLEAGIDVICDKPLTTTFADAQDLVATVRRTGRLLGVTYNYTGYPMVRELWMVRSPSCAPVCSWATASNTCAKATRVAMRRSGRIRAILAAHAGRIFANGHADRRLLSGVVQASIQRGIDLY